MGSLCGADRDDFCLWTSCYKFSLCVVWIGDVIYVSGDPEEAGHSWMVEDVRLCGGVFNAEVPSIFEFCFNSFAVSNS